MTARLAEGGTSWDDMLDAAVLQGLTAAPGEETAAPNQWRLTSGAEDGEDEEDAADANDAADAEDDLEELHGSLAHEVSASLQAATARSVMLLRRGPSSAELQAEIESWLLEGGRMQARLEDALAAGLSVARASCTRARRAESQLAASGRALGDQLVKSATAAREAAAREVCAAREREISREIAAEAAELAAETAAAAEAEAAEAAEEAAEAAAAEAAAHEEGEAPDPFGAVCLHFGDATIGTSLDFTHIYAFDRVFSPKTLTALAAILTASPFYVLVSYRPPAEWWQHGLTTVQPVAKMRLQTTGKETMNCYVYINTARLPASA